MEEPLAANTGFSFYSILSFAIGAMIIDNVLGTTFKMNSISGFSMTMPYGYVYVLYGLAVFLPGLALSVRRLHDVNKSGWFFLIVLIPFVGAIWLIVLMVTDSDPKDNKYGPNPMSMPLEAY